jgi:hypothetical protein
MDLAKINKQLELITIQSKLIITLRHYLFIHVRELGWNFLDLTTELLNQKYNDTQFSNFLELRRKGMWCHNDIILYRELCRFIGECKNIDLLTDLYTTVNLGYTPRILK